jgi:peptidoglycan/LPS O-acetylase OafA/YrhL
VSAGVAAPAAVAAIAQPAASADAAARSPELDGIRAIAIWMVLAIHITLQGDAAQAGAALHGAARIAFLGISHMWLGVDLFFVLSGFLITGILLDLRGRPGYFRTFWVRRALRIVPLVAVVLIVLAFFKPGHGAWYALGAAFLADIAPFVGATPPNGAPPLWSLAVEEQFYLLWPVLVWTLGGRRLALLAAAIVVCEPVIRYAWSGALLEVPWFRSDGLAVGALAALWVRTPDARSRSAAVLAAVVAAVAGLAVLELAARDGSLATALRLTEANLLFGAAIVAVVIWRGAPAFAPLRSRFLRFSAETSFCVYLIHIPLLSWVEGTGLTAAASPFVAALLRAAWVLPLAFALATLSRLVLELPALRLKRILAP